MGEQDDRYGWRKPPRVAGSDTSAAAAKRQVPKKVERDRRTIVNLLLSGGKTDEELCDISGMEPNTERPRRRELVKQGKVEDSGERRKTRTGSPATVWRLKR